MLWLDCGQPSRLYDTPVCVDNVPALRCKPPSRRRHLDHCDGRDGAGRRLRAATPSPTFLGLGFCICTRRVVSHARGRNTPPTQRISSDYPRRATRPVAAICNIEPWVATPRLRLLSSAYFTLCCITCMDWHGRQGIEPATRRFGVSLATLEHAPVCCPSIMFPLWFNRRAAGALSLQSLTRIIVLDTCRRIRTALPSHQTSAN